MAGALVPAGLHAVRSVSDGHRRWLPFAVFPLAFSLQQTVEGVVWLGLNDGNEALVSGASRGFLFFSHFFWLAWPPFAAFWVETRPGRRRFLLALTVLGFLFGLSIFLPATLWSDGLRVEVIEGNLEYKTRLIYEGIVSRPALRVFYALIVISALLASSHRPIQIFGTLILVSVVATYLLFPHAFISVWCYFAAVLSAYMVALAAWLRRERRPAFATPADH